ncbi:hypothetical protein OG948_33285 [Embleya sp. NBC_00888]|uniref:hypothetical protein n=1 Tax=Embleya sp. NBC_00888 TaxID=2975960 RepID=UPI00386758BA|nr:hypothetical protein OG948_33285 [Embleya sp. NBC_00888]
MHWLSTLTDAVNLLPADTPTPGSTNNPNPGGIPNPPPVAPPGLQEPAGKWISWGKWIAGLAGVLGLIACGVMMAIGRRNRAHLAAEGANGILWTVAGVSLAMLAAGVVPGLMGM